MHNKYQNLKIYDPEKLVKNSKDIFFIEMVKIREELLNQYLNKNYKVVDLCCGAGAYFENIINFTDDIIAVDNTERYLEYININYPNIKTLLTDASDLSQVTDKTVDLVFCYSSLYYIEGIENVLKEIKRVLKKDGTGILEFGNKYSINALISKQFEKSESWAKSYPISYKEIITILSKKLNFKIVEKRHFQITSYYGSIKKFSIMNFVSHPFLQKFFCFKIKNKMIDEWISSLLPHLSFKKIIVVKS